MTHPLEDENRRLREALQHARGTITAIMSDGNCDCRKDFAIIDAALAAEPASGEAKPLREMTHAEVLSIYNEDD